MGERAARNNRGWITMVTVQELKQLLDTYCCDDQEQLVYVENEAGDMAEINGVSISSEGELFIY